MATYKAPIQDIMFALKTFEYTDRVASYDAYQDFDIETFQALLEGSADVLINELLPLNEVGDKIGLKWDPETGDVTTPPGFKEAYKKIVENGITSISGPADYSGAGGPEPINVAGSEIMISVNKSFSMCPGLTRGLVDAVHHHGTDAQKDTYLHKINTGEWTGTMCLTEPQAGTDLGLVNTKAIPEGDHFRLSGTKIWITFGEHDMADNIIHMVLARLPGAPEGIKGISTFLVPKMIGDERNSIICTGLEHKMGIKASPTCVMELENAKGFLIGEPHKGMRVMFTMMNIARLYVGLEGIGLSEIAYQTAVEFAKERRQSRALDDAKQDPSASADNIFVHPDVRRMLLNIKSTNEAMRALALWISIEHVVGQNDEDETVRQEANDLVALLTPIIKSYGSERGFENISEAMQVLGGAGYTTDFNIEQYLRDERIAMIYEGTNHIQALDLVGRKLPMKGGRLMQTFAARITALIRANKENEAMAEFIGPMKEASKVLTGVTMEMAGAAMQDREVAGAVANAYLNLFAITTMAFTWCQMAKYALDNPGPLSTTKLKTARYFMQKILPETHSYVAIIKTGKANMMEFEVDEF